MKETSRGIHNGNEWDLKGKVGIFFSDGWVLSQSQPWVGLEAFLGPISVVVEQLGPGFDVCLGHQYQPGYVADENHFGLAVGSQAGVIDQTPQASTLGSGVNTA